MLQQHAEDHRVVDRLEDAEVLEVRDEVLPEVLVDEPLGLRRLPPLVIDLLAGDGPRHVPTVGALLVREAEVRVAVRQRVGQ